MSKKIMSDIIVPKKSIRQIPVTIRKERQLEPETEDSPKVKESFVASRLRRSPSWQRKPLNPKFIIWLIAGICVLALFFGVSIIFSSATVTVTPRTEKITFNKDVYLAKVNANSTSSLAFEVLNVKQTVGEIVQTTDEKDVSQKATGVIVIYNNYSTAPQRLINNTRFEANNGKIYRINSSVIIPGLKKVNGKNIPGSIEATVYADQAGDTYNMKVSDLVGDFKIPGFKGDIRYDGFYARLKSDITGGFIGKQRVVGDDLRKATEESIKIRLKEQLLKELYVVKPENYLILNNGYSIDYTNVPDTAVDNNKVKINIEGNLNGIVFNNSKLSKYLATKKITGFDGLDTEFVPTGSLVTTFKAADTTGLWKNSTIEITFDGEANIKWQYNVDDLKNDLAGKKEADLNNIMAKYKNSISGLSVVFMPIWSRYFPDNLNRIKIKEAAF